MTFDDNTIVALGVSNGSCLEVFDYLRPLCFLSTILALGVSKGSCLEVFDYLLPRCFIEDRGFGGL